MQLQLSESFMTTLRRFAFRTRGMPEVPACLKVKEQLR